MYSSRLTAQLVVFVLISPSRASTFNTSHLQLLLPDGYSSEQPPVDKAGELVRVHVNLVILDIGDIDEYNLDFHLQVYVTLHWRDAGIVVDEGFGPDGLTLPSYIERRLWRPTIVFDNAEFADGRPPGATTIYDDKQLATTVRYNLRVRCDVDFTYYPLDSQHCALLVRSGAEDVSYVWLQWAAGGATIQLRGPNNNNFMVEAGASGSFNYSLRIGSFPVLYMPFVFRRRITSRVIKTYLPSSLVVMLSWASFWIDLSSISARISLVINCVLTVTIQIGRDQSTFWLLNALDVWLFTCELFLVAAVIELAVAFTVGKWTAVKWEIDELRRLAQYAGLESELSEILRAGGESVDKTPGPTTAGEPMEEKLDEVEPEEEQQALETHALVSFLKVTRKFQDPRDPVDLRCRCVFPITFAVFVVTYWAVLSYYALRETDREVAQELARSLPVF